MCDLFDLLLGAFREQGKKSPTGASSETVSHNTNSENDAPSRAEVLRTIKAEAISLEQIPSTHTHMFDMRAHHVILDSLTQVQNEQADLTSRHQDELRYILPCEEAIRRLAVAEYQRKYQALSQRMATLRSEYKLARGAVHRVDAIFSRIDMRFMQRRKWSQGISLPLFAMFAVDNPLCSVSGVANSGQDPNWNFRPNRVVPHAFASWINPTIHIIDSGLGRREKWLPVHFSAQFADAIPDGIRKEIQRLKPSFDLFIVREVDWETPANVPEVKLPSQLASHQQYNLLIGKRGDVFWLVAGFATDGSNQYHFYRPDMWDHAELDIGF
jgi:hypothetical protein